MPCSLPRELSELHCLCALLKGEANRILPAMILSEVVAPFAAIDAEFMQNVDQETLVFMYFVVSNMKRHLN
jgi:hypothetical protein